MWREKASHIILLNVLQSTVLIIIILVWRRPIRFCAQHSKENRCKYVIFNLFVRCINKEAVQTALDMLYTEECTKVFFILYAKRLVLAVDETPPTMCLLCIKAGRHALSICLYLL